MELLGMAPQIPLSHSRPTIVEVLFVDMLLCLFLFFLNFNLINFDSSHCPVALVALSI